MAKTENSNHLQVKSKIDSRVITYTIIIVVCSIVSICFHLYHAHQYAVRQQQIILVYEKSMESSSNLTSQNKSRLIEQIAASNQKQQEEVKALLELEFNKIQNEYETQEIWTAVLTIVFLIFSFYSLFKSEQLERQGQESLDTIREVEKRAKFAYDKIEKEKSKKINSIQSQYNEWKAQKQRDITESLRKSEDDLKDVIKNEREKSVAELQSDYVSISTQFKTTIERENKTLIEGLISTFKEREKMLVKELQEKNAVEIQNQVDLWASRMTDLKESYERQFNQILEEQTLLQQEDEFGVEENHSAEDESKIALDINIEHGGEDTDDDDTLQNI